MSGNPIQRIKVFFSLFQLIKLLVENGAHVDIKDNQDRTPLHFAVVANRLSVIQLLIKSGKSVCYIFAVLNL